MPLDLSSVRAKLARSQEHAQAVNNEIVAWTERNPYSLIEKTDVDGTRYSLILRINEPPPFQRWSLMIADALSNLRCALDHLVYAVACHESAPNLPAYESKLMFPITDSGPNFNKAITDRKQLGMISDPIRTVIEASQPYNRPHESLPPLLSILNELNNRDKHRVLQVAISTVEEGQIELIGDCPQDGRTWIPVHCFDEIKDGAEVLTMVCDRPTPNMKFNKHVLHVVIAVQHGNRDPSGPVWTGRTSFDVLYEFISREVRRIIYNIDNLIK